MGFFKLVRSRLARTTVLLVRRGLVHWLGEIVLESAQSSHRGKPESGRSRVESQQFNHSSTFRHNFTQNDRDLQLIEKVLQIKEGFGAQSVGFVNDQHLDTTGLQGAVDATADFWQGASAQLIFQGG